MATASPTKPMSPTAKPRGAPRAAPARGKLEWRTMLAWLREDGLIDHAAAEAVAKRFGGADSSQHPLVRLGSAGLKRHGTQTLLDTEALTQWLALRFNLPYLRIDPLKVDVGRVADVMSVHYAEVRRVLPVTVGAAEVAIATAEPFDNAWVPEIEAHTRKSVKLVVSNPLDIARYSSSVGTLPAGWSFYTFWQWADSGTFPGAQDRFNGALRRVQASAKG